jgi:hypothetical protein
MSATEFQPSDFPCVLTMMASEDPIVEVPIVFASSWVGALNSLAIMLTHPVYRSATVSQLYGVWCERTVLDVGADGVLFVVDEVLREGVAVGIRLCVRSRRVRIIEHTP